MGGATTSFNDTDLMESIDGNARELEELDNIMEIARVEEELRETQQQQA